MTAAALLLLAAPLFADAPAVTGKAVAADAGMPSIRQCKPGETKSIRAALGVAADWAESCLKGGLAPDLGESVLGLFQKQKLALFCDGDSPDNANAATSFKDGLAQISVFSTTNGQANDMSPEGLGRVLFHELIHAADPDKKLIASQLLHDKAYPDRVYACHLACTGAGGNEGMKARLALLMHAAGKRLEPASGGARCPPGGDCSFQKLMGALCGAGGDWWTNFERKEEARFEQTGCLLRAVAVEGTCKAEVCAGIQRQVKDASAKGPPPASLTGALMIHLYDVAAAARSKQARAALSERDAELFEAVQESGALKTCGAGR